MDHDRNIADMKDIGQDHAKCVADLVLCALRIANTFPGGVICRKLSRKELKVRMESNSQVVTDNEADKADEEAFALTVQIVQLAKQRRGYKHLMKKWRAALDKSPNVGPAVRDALSHVR